MKLALPTIIFCLAAGMWSFAAADEKTPATKPSTQPAAVNKFCPIMTEHQADPEATYEHKGKIYAFCCTGCIDEFKADPDKHAANAK